MNQNFIKLITNFRRSIAENLDHIEWSLTDKTVQNSHRILYLSVTKMSSMKTENNSFMSAKQKSLIEL